ncbi:MAG: cbb3-type cytochrome c oxidase subunit I [Bacteroidetes bacterium]|jgi:nitric oxide reductase subunit B|nr:cbb3-type cytochrome c oxidase subunit I [Bacteroidota bacterium]
MRKINFGNLFLVTAIVMLLSGLVFGVLAAIIYIAPDFLKNSLGFISLRPLHVSSALLWIFLGATGSVYNGIRIVTKKEVSNPVAFTQWLLWMIAIIGIFTSYFTHQFGGREYWEFNPVWALPIAIAWILFFINFYKHIYKVRNWPVYMWMWFTGLVFFFFSFSENYLWLFPVIREHFVTDMTIQWKVNGSLVGAWNQLIYGTAFFLMDRISGTKDVGKNNLAFAMYFLGLFNLMFNWGHHIYTLPTENYIRYIGYAVSMTEWIFFAKIIYNWKKSVSDIQKHYHYFPYRFLMASDIWVFINIGQASLLSIPAINIYTHGTHITVAHAMGTTIGINSMILLAACFEFLKPELYRTAKPSRSINFAFWMLQISLVILFLSLNIAGFKKGIWQLTEEQSSYSVMMQSLQPYFISFLIAGIGLMISFSIFAGKLLKQARKSILLSHIN